jgi:hypothetical protein
MKVFVVALAALLLLGATVAPVRAEEDDGSDDEKNFFNRKIEVEANSGESATFKSEGDDGSQLYVRISEDGGMKLKVELETADDQESKALFRIDSLVEYVNQDGQPGYNPKDDREVSTKDLTALNWVFACTKHSDQYWSCSMDSAGNMNFTFHVVGEVVRRTGLPDLLPNGVEFDVDFVKSTANPVAFLCRYEAEVELESDDTDESPTEKDDDVRGDKDTLKVSGGRFSWLKTATLNGNPVPVEVFAQDDKDFTFAFATTATGVVTWDPFVAANFRSSAGALVPALTTLLVTLFAFLL